MEDIRYLNLDLLIKSRQDITPLIVDFGADVTALANEKCGDFYFCYFEIAGSHAGLNEDIGYFCSLVEGLEMENKKLWDSSFHRIFDIGYEAGSSGNSYSSDLKPDVIKRISAVGASIRITIYPYAEKPEYALTNKD